MDATITKDVLFNAPLETVFDFVTRAENNKNCWPGLLSYSNLVDLPNGGEEFDFVFMMAGVKINGHSRDLQYERPTKIVTESISGIKSIQTWTFEHGESDGVTRATFEAKYVIPVPIIGGITAKAIASFTEVDVDAYIRNLKSFLNTP